MNNTVPNTKECWHFSSTIPNVECTEIIEPDNPLMWSMPLERCTRCGETRRIFRTKDSGKPAWRVTWRNCWIYELRR